MSQLVKSIVNELNKAPFNLNLTAVNFNTLQPPQLLQVNDVDSSKARAIKLTFFRTCNRMLKLLSDVICEIESKEKIDISEEPIETLTLRLLTSLQILKFKPENENP